MQTVSERAVDTGLFCLRALSWNGLPL